MGVPALFRYFTLIPTLKSCYLFPKFQNLHTFSHPPFVIVTSIQRWLSRKYGKIVMPVIEEFPVKVPSASGIEGEFDEMVSLPSLSLSPPLPDDKLTKKNRLANNSL